MYPVVSHTGSEFGFDKIENFPLARKVANAASAFNQGNDGTFLF
jgi:hypothetical protein